MPKTTVPCPQCRQPITIDLNRLFDMNTDSEAKQKLLSGQANYFSCPICKAQGVYPTPVVYHDSDKELLLTYFPPEANVPLHEQEKIIGPLIKKVVDDLPSEKRKAYIFRPQSMLSQQHLFERILEGDGVTPEMLKAQQERLNLIQTLAMAKPDVIAELIRQNDAKIDEEFFGILSKLAQVTAASGDQQGAQLLSNLQKNLLENSTFGKKAAEEAKEARAVIEELQSLSKAGLTREGLLNLLLKSADSELKVSTITAMARSGMDYDFFALLTAKIEAAQGEDKQKLVSLRENLLKLTQEIDAELKVEIEQAQKILDELLKSENLEEATQKALPQMNQAFGDVLNAEAQKAQEAHDEAKLKKLASIVTVLQSASASGAYMQLIEMLLQAKDEAERKEIYAQAGEALSGEFVSMMAGLIDQVEKSKQQPELAEKLKAISKEALRFSMEQNLKKDKSA
ncbi:MAG: CpXC domain-containing protein [Anaerolineaceae bacterium]|nr:CpXC domain-containing protein [Anaerolineaceae bacterium]